MVGPPGSRVLALSGIRHLASGIGRPAARGIVALVACGCAWAAEPARPLAVGETVEVAVDAAAMKVRRQVVAALKRGDRLVVERLWDQWLWSTVGAGGESKSGWVRVDQVRRVGPAAALALDVGDQVAVTAESADVLAAGARIATLPRRYLFVVEAARQGHVATTVDVGGKPVQGWVSTQRLRRVRPGEELGIEDGDQVVVAADKAPVTLEGRTLATLPRRYVFTVERVREGLFATTVDVGGRATQGWVAARHVRRATPRDLPTRIRLWQVARRPLCSLDLQAVVRESLAVSPDGWRLAFVERRGKGFRVVVDGLPGPDCKLVAPGTPVFSPDSRRLAYAALDGGRWRVVVDNFPGPPFERLGGVAFSPEGRHVAYAALKAHKWRVLLDGQPGPPFEDVARASLAFSPDGKRLAYAAKQWDKWRVVLDGKPGPEFDEVGGLLFSPDGRRRAATARGSLPASGKPATARGERRLLYAARLASRWHVVVDGERGPAFEAIEGRKFSPDGRRVAYVARAEGQFRVVVDGFVGAPCDGILAGSPVFSPDGRRVAYGATRGEAAHVVLDGKAQRSYDAIAGLTFSPDSRRVAYAAQKGIVWHVVVDGVEGLPYDAVAKGTPVFSPDSRRVAFVGRVAGRSMAVLDGQPGPTHDGVLTASPLFSPDGRHVAYVVVSGKTWRVVHDGRPGPPCDGIGAGMPLFSPDSRRMAYVAIQGNRWRLVVHGEPGPPCDEIGEVAFSPDGKHIACTARDGKLWRVVVDGEAGELVGGLVKGSRLFFTDAGALRYLAWTLKGNALTISRIEHTPRR